MHTNFQHDFALVNGEKLHFAHQGEGRPILFLHGFPAFWRVWQSQLAHFGKSMWAIAPDGRGVNLSSKPTDLDAYRIDVLAADVVGLVDHLGIDQFVLVGHDWGGAVAWEVARRYPARVSHLIVANAPPWAVFMRALATLPEQRAASVYVDRLKADTAEPRLLADNCAALWQATFGRLVAEGVVDPAERDAYQACWQAPGSLTGFLNWYRANVPDFDEIDAALFQSTAENLIHTPTRLLWGEHEGAFTRPLLDLIPSYAPQLELQIVPGANHWIHLEQPELFNAAIEAFCENL